MTTQAPSKERDICTKCRWPLQSCDCCGLCGEPECNCAEELNGDTSEPLGDSSESLGLSPHTCRCGICQQTMDPVILPAASSHEPPAALHCTDCRLLYSDPGWADFVVADAVWQVIAPEGGVLCATCMFRRMLAQGIELAEGRFTSGPCAQHDWKKPASSQPPGESLSGSAEPRGDAAAAAGDELTSALSILRRVAAALPDSDRRKSYAELAIIWLEPTEPENKQGHVCGLQGFDPMKGDECSPCSTATKGGE